MADQIPDSIAAAFGAPVSTPASLAPAALAPTSAAISGMSEKEFDSFLRAETKGVQFFAPDNEMDLDPASSEGPNVPIEYLNVFGNQIPVAEVVKYKDGARLLGLAAANRKGRRGFGEALTDLEYSQIPFAGDVIGGIIDAKTVLPIAYKIKRGEQPTVDELITLRAYLADDERKAQATNAGAIGDVLRSLSGFAAEIGLSTVIGAKIGLDLAAPEAAAVAATGAGLPAAAAIEGTAGALGAAGGAAAGTANAARKILATKGTKRLLKELVEGWSKEMIGKEAVHMVKLGTTTFGIDAAVDAVANVALGQDPLQSQGSIQRETYAALHGEDLSPGAAQGLALVDKYIEHLSEASGGLMGELLAKPVGRGLGAIAGRSPAFIAGSKMIADLNRTWGHEGPMLAAMGEAKTRMSNVLASDASFMKKIPAALGFSVAALSTKYNISPQAAIRKLKVMGYDGWAQEMLEERFGGALRGLFGIQGDEDDSILRNVWEQMIPTTDQFKVEAIAFAVPLGIVHGVRTAQGSRWLAGTNLSIDRKNAQILAQAIKGTANTPLQYTPETDEEARSGTGAMPTSTDRAVDSMEALVESSEARKGRRPRVGWAATVADYTLRAIETITTGNFDALNYNSYDKFMAEAGLSSDLVSYAAGLKNAEIVARTAEELQNPVTKVPLTEEELAAQYRPQIRRSYRQLIDAVRESLEKSGVSGKTVADIVIPEIAADRAKVKGTTQEAEELAVRAELEAAGAGTEDSDIARAMAKKSGEMAAGPNPKLWEIGGKGSKIKYSTINPEALDILELAVNKLFAAKGGRTGVFDISLIGGEADIETPSRTQRIPIDLIRKVAGAANVQEILDSPELSGMLFRLGRAARFAKPLAQPIYEYAKKLVSHADMMGTVDAFDVASEDEDNPYTIVVKKNPLGVELRGTDARSRAYLNSVRDGKKAKKDRTLLLSGVEGEAAVYQFLGPGAQIVAVRNDVLDVTFGKGMAVRADNPFAFLIQNPDYLPSKASLAEWTKIYNEYKEWRRTAGRNVKASDNNDSGLHTALTHGGAGVQNLSLSKAWTRAEAIITSETEHVSKVEGGLYQYNYQGHRRSSRDGRRSIIIDVNRESSSLAIAEEMLEQAIVDAGLLDDPKKDEVRADRVFMSELQALLEERRTAIRQAISKERGEDDPTHVPNGAKLAALETLMAETDRYADYIGGGTKPTAEFYSKTWNWVFMGHAEAAAADKATMAKGWKALTNPDLHMGPGGATYTLGDAIRSLPSAKDYVRLMLSVLSVPVKEGKIDGSVALAPYLLEGHETGYTYKVAGAATMPILPRLQNIMAGSEAVPNRSKPATTLVPKAPVVSPAGVVAEANNPVLPNAVVVEKAKAAEQVVDGKEPRINKSVVLGLLAKIKDKSAQERPAPGTEEDSESSLIGKFIEQDPTIAYTMLDFVKAAAAQFAPRVAELDAAYYAAEALHTAAVNNKAPASVIEANLAAAQALYVERATETAKLIKTWTGDSMTTDAFLHAFIKSEAMFEADEKTKAAMYRGDHINSPSDDEDPDATVDIEGRRFDDPREREKMFSASKICQMVHAMVSVLPTGRRDFPTYWHTLGEDIAEAVNRNAKGASIDDLMIMFGDLKSIKNRTAFDAWVSQPLAYETAPHLFVLRKAMKALGYDRAIQFLGKVALLHSEAAVRVTVDAQTGVLSFIPERSFGTGSEKMDARSALVTRWTNPEHRASIIALINKVMYKVTKADGTEVWAPRDKYVPLGEGGLNPGATTDETVPSRMRAALGDTWETLFGPGSPVTRYLRTFLPVAISVDPKDKAALDEAKKPGYLWGQIANASDYKKGFGLLAALAKLDAEKKYAASDVEAALNSTLFRPVSHVLGDNADASTSDFDRLIFSMFGSRPATSVELRTQNIPGETDETKRVTTGRRGTIVTLADYRSSKERLTPADLASGLNSKPIADVPEDPAARAAFFREHKELITAPETLVTKQLGDIDLEGAVVPTATRLLRKLQSRWGRTGVPKTIMFTTISTPTTISEEDMGWDEEQRSAGTFRSMNLSDASGKDLVALTTAVYTGFKPRGDTKKGRPIPINNKAFIREFGARAAYYVPFFLELGGKDQRIAVTVPKDLLTFDGKPWNREAPYHLVGNTVELNPKSNLLPAAQAFARMRYLTTEALIEGLPAAAVAKRSSTFMTEGQAPLRGLEDGLPDVARIAVIRSVKDKAGNDIPGMIEFLRGQMIVPSGKVHRWGRSFGRAINASNICSWSNLKVHIQGGNSYFKPNITSEVQSLPARGKEGFADLMEAFRKFDDGLPLEEQLFAITDKDSAKVIPAKDSTGADMPATEIKLKDGTVISFLIIPVETRHMREVSYLEHDAKMGKRLMPSPLLSDSVGLTDSEKIADMAADALTGMLDGLEEAGVTPSAADVIREGDEARHAPIRGIAEDVVGTLAVFAGDAGAAVVSAIKKTTGLVGSAVYSVVVSPGGVTNKATGAVNWIGGVVNKHLLPYTRRANGGFTPGLIEANDRTPTSRRGLLLSLTPVTLPSGAQVTGPVALMNEWKTRVVAYVTLARAKGDRDPITRAAKAQVLAMVHEEVPGGIQTVDARVSFDDLVDADGNFRDEAVFSPGEKVSIRYFDKSVEMDSPATDLDTYFIAGSLLLDNRTPGGPNNAHRPVRVSRPVDYVVETVDVRYITATGELETRKEQRYMPANMNRVTSHPWFFDTVGFDTDGDTGASFESPVRDGKPLTMVSDPADIYDAVRDEVIELVVGLDHTKELGLPGSRDEKQAGEYRRRLKAGLSGIQQRYSADFVRLVHASYEKTAKENGEIAKNFGRDEFTTGVNPDKADTYVAPDGRTVKQVAADRVSPSTMDGFARNTDNQGAGARAKNIIMATLRSFQRVLVLGEATYSVRDTAEGETVAALLGPDGKDLISVERTYDDPEARKISDGLARQYLVDVANTILDQAKKQNAHILGYMPTFAPILTTAATGQLFRNEADVKAFAEKFIVWVASPTGQAYAAAMESRRDLISGSEAPKIVANVEAATFTDKDAYKDEDVLLSRLVTAMEGLPAPRRAAAIRNLFRLDMTAKQIGVLGRVANVGRENVDGPERLGRVKDGIEAWDTARKNTAPFAREKNPDGSPRDPKEYLIELDDSHSRVRFSGTSPVLKKMGDSASRLIDTYTDSAFRGSWETSVLSSEALRTLEAAESIRGKMNLFTPFAKKMVAARAIAALIPADLAAAVAAEYASKPHMAKSYWLDFGVKLADALLTTGGAVGRGLSDALASRIVANTPKRIAALTVSDETGNYIRDAQAAFKALARSRVPSVQIGNVTVPSSAYGPILALYTVLEYGPSFSGAANFFKFIDPITLGKISVLIQNILQGKSAATQLSGKEIATAFLAVIDDAALIKSADRGQREQAANVLKGVMGPGIKFGGALTPEGMDTERKRYFGTEAAPARATTAAVAAVPVVPPVTKAPVAQVPKSSIASLATVEIGETITLFRGEGKGSAKNGTWWTGNIEKARRYADPGTDPVRATFVATRERLMSAAMGHNGEDEWLFPDEGRNPRAFEAEDKAPSAPAPAAPAADTFEIVGTDGPYDVSGMRADSGRANITNTAPGKPGWLGNPFLANDVAGGILSREEATVKFGEVFGEKVAKDAEFRAAVLALRGKKVGYYKPAEDFIHLQVVQGWLADVYDLANPQGIPLSSRTADELGRMLEELNFWSISPVISDNPFSRSAHEEAIRQVEARLAEVAPPVAEPAAAFKSTIDSINRARDAAAVQKRLPGLTEEGRDDVVLVSKDASELARGYTRVVYGDHGPYVELSRDQVNWGVFPASKHRVKGANAWYDEWYTKDGVMLYEQRRDVSMLPNPPAGKYSARNDRKEGYADYKVGRFYISTDDIDIVGTALATPVAVPESRPMQQTKIEPAPQDPEKYAANAVEDVNPDDYEEPEFKDSPGLRALNALDFSGLGDGLPGATTPPVQSGPATAKPEKSAPAPAPAVPWTTETLKASANSVPGGLRLSIEGKMLPGPVRFNGFNGYGANGTVTYRKKDGKESTWVVDYRDLIRDNPRLASALGTEVIGAMSRLDSQNRSLALHDVLEEITTAPAESEAPAMPSAEAAKYPTVRVDRARFATPTELQKYVSALAPGTKVDFYGAHPEPAAAPQVTPQVAPQAPSPIPDNVIAFNTNGKNGNTPVAFTRLLSGVWAARFMSNGREKMMIATPEQVATNWPLRLSVREKTDAKRPPAAKPVKEAKGTAKPGLLPSEIVPGMIMLSSSGKMVPATPGQTEALGRMDNIAAAALAPRCYGAKPTGYTLVVKGRPGTGKTSILNEFLRRVRLQYGSPHAPMPSSIALAAPTHAARGVVSMLTTFWSKISWSNKAKATRPDVKTTASLLGQRRYQPRGKDGRPDATYGQYGSGESGGWYPIPAKSMASGSKQPDIAKTALVVVDESSMVSSGEIQLLQEWQKILGNSLIFLGDPAQLPQVGGGDGTRAANIGPVFQPDFEADSVELVDVMRQSRDNPILRVLEPIRKAIFSTDPEAAREALRVPNAEAISPSGEGYASSSSASHVFNELKSSITNDLFRRDPLSLRIYSPTNVGVRDWNKLIYNHLFPKSTRQVEPGALIRAYANAQYDEEALDSQGRGFGEHVGLPKFTNSDDFVVSTVGDPQALGGPVPELAGLRGRFVELEYVRPGDTVTGTPSHRIFLVDNGTHGTTAEGSKLLAAINALRLKKDAAFSEARKNRNWGAAFAAQALVDLASVSVVSFDTQMEGRQSDAETASEGGLAKAMDLGYASTIHKGQGATNKVAIIDTGAIAMASKFGVFTQLQLLLVGISRPSKAAIVIQPGSDAKWDKATSAALRSVLDKADNRMVEPALVESADDYGKLGNTSSTSSLIGTYNPQDFEGTQTLSTEVLARAERLRAWGSRLPKNDQGELSDASVEFAKRAVLASLPEGKDLGPETESWLDDQLDARLQSDPAYLASTFKAQLDVRRENPARNKYRALYTQPANHWLNKVAALDQPGVDSLATLPPEIITAKDDAAPSLESLSTASDLPAAIAAVAQFRGIPASPELDKVLEIAGEKDTPLYDRFNELDALETDGNLATLVQSVRARLYSDASEEEQNEADAKVLGTPHREEGSVIKTSRIKRQPAPEKVPNSPLTSASCLIGNHKDFLNSLIDPAYELLGKSLVTSTFTDESGRGESIAQNIREYYGTRWRQMMGLFDGDGIIRKATYPMVPEFTPAVNGDQSTRKRTGKWVKSETPMYERPWAGGLINKAGRFNAEELLEVHFFEYAIRFAIPAKSRKVVMPLRDVLNTPPPASVLTPFSMRHPSERVVDGTAALLPAELRRRLSGEIRDVIAAIPVPAEGRDDPQYVQSVLRALYLQGLIWARPELSDLAKARNKEAADQKLPVKNTFEDYVMLDPKLSVPLRMASAAWEASDAKAYLVQLGRDPAWMSLSSASDIVSRGYSKLEKDVNEWVPGVATEDGRYLHHRVNYIPQSGGNGYIGRHIITAEDEVKRDLDGQIADTYDRYVALLGRYDTGRPGAQVLASDPTVDLEVWRQFARLHDIPERDAVAIRKRAVLGELVNYGVNRDTTAAELLSTIYDATIQKLVVQKLNGQEDEGTGDLRALAKAIRDLARRDPHIEEPKPTLRRQFDSYEDMYAAIGVMPSSKGTIEEMLDYTNSLVLATATRIALCHMLLSRDITGRPIICGDPNPDYPGSSVVPDAVWMQAARNLHDYLTGTGEEVPVDFTRGGRDAMRQLASRALTGNASASIWKSRKTTPYMEISSRFGSIAKFYALKEEKASDDAVLDFFVGGEAAGRLKQVLRVGDIDDPKGILASLLKAAAWMKTMAMQVSFFFPVAIVESGVAAVGPHILNSRMARMFGHNNYLSPWEMMTMMRTGHPYFRYLTTIADQAGIRLSTESGNPFDIPVGYVGKTTANMSKAVERNLGPRAGRNFRAGMKFATHDMTDYYFNHLMNGMKLAVTNAWLIRLEAAHKASGSPIPFDPVESLRRVSGYINKEVGAIDLNRYAWATPDVRRIANLGLFSLQWTLGAWEAAGGNLLTGSMLGDRLTPEETGYIFSKRWPLMLGLVMLAEPFALQLGAYLAGSGDDREKRKHDKPFIWQNGPEKGLYADMTPLMRKLPWYTGGSTGERRVYMRFGKQGHEIAGWLEDPVKTLGGKMSLPAQMAWGMATGKSPGSDWDLGFGQTDFLSSIFHGDDGSFWSGRGALALKGFTPFSLNSLISNPDAAPLSLFGPTSRGLGFRALSDTGTEILRSWVKSERFEKVRHSPKLMSNLDALLVEVVEAAEANGYDAKAVLRAAYTPLRTELYRDLYEAVENKDYAKAERVGDALLRLNAKASGAQSSFRRRNIQANKPKQLSPEQSEAIRGAFEGRGLAPAAAGAWEPGELGDLGPAATPPPANEKPPAPEGSRWQEDFLNGLR